MALDDATRKLAQSLEGELQRLADVMSDEQERGERVRYDSVSRLATFETRTGEVKRRLYAELLATWVARDRILRWAWAGRSMSAAVSFADLVFREGNNRNVPQLAMSVVGDVGEEEARTLARIGAVVAQAKSMHARTIGTEIEFLGIFDKPRPSESSSEIAAAGFSLPPPPVAEPTPRSIPPVRPAREVYDLRTPSLPPIAPPAPAPSAPAMAGSKRITVREPKREIFVPVASAAMAALAKGSPGYQQGLFVIAIDEGARRFVVQLAVVDSGGILRAIDAPQSLLESAAAMIEADRRDGNASWRKLTARISPRPGGGAGFAVDVV